MGRCGKGLPLLLDEVCCDGISAAYYISFLHSVAWGRADMTRLSAFFWPVYMRYWFA
jgi:hypothetical protein